MKTVASLNQITGLILAMAWLPGGLAQNTTNRPLTSASDATPVVTPARPATEPSPRALTSPLDVFSPAVIPLPDDATSKNRQPPKIRLSPWATEILKLAEARIGDDVMYSFIDNSGTFNLGAEQIIYLSDVGVPSQIISAMLQHDQDLVSGVRSLTVASEPAYEPILPAIVAASSDGSVKTSSQPALVPSAPVSATAGLEAASGMKSPPEINPSVPDVQLAAVSSTKRDELASAKPPTVSAQGQMVAKKKSLYPVREPQPVELTAPIIFIEGEERPANTIIIVGFPRTESSVPLTSEVKPSVLSSPGAASRSRASFPPR